MINLTKVEYDIVGITGFGDRVHLTPIIEEAATEENDNELAVRATVSFQNQLYKGQRINELFPNGTWIMIYADWGVGMQETFRGMVRRWHHVDRIEKRLTLTAYDPLFPLSKSKADYWWEHGTDATTIVRRIFQDWGLSDDVAEISMPVIFDIGESPVVGLTQQAFRGTPLSDQILQVLEQSRLLGAGRFVVRSQGDVATVVKYGSNKDVYFFSEDVAAGVEDDWNSENIVTRVRILGVPEPTGAAEVVETVDGRTELGVIQDIIYQDRFITNFDAHQSAELTLYEKGQEEQLKRIDSMDVPPLRRGDLVRVAASTVNGFFWISNIHRDLVKRTMTMELKIIDPEPPVIINSGLLP